ncbi:MAG: general secretion pathway protein N [Psychromonas sp.]
MVLNHDANKEMLLSMKIKLILLFVLFYLLSLLITLPASTVMRFIPQNSGIEVAAVSGSAWQGKAFQFTYQNKYHLQQLDWKVDWLALTNLQLKLDLKFNNGSNAMAGKGFLLLGFSGISVENVIVDLSASELLSYLHLPLPVPVDATGELSLVIKNGQQGLPYCQQLDGVIAWQNAKINSEMGNIDLGVVNIDLSCEKGQLVADLEQNSEQLSSTINILLKEKGAYQLQGLLKESNKLDPSIRQVLPYIGAKNKSGETVLNFNGKL